MIDLKGFIRYYKTELQSIDESDVDSKFRQIHLLGVLNEQIEKGEIIWGEKEQKGFREFTIKQVQILMNNDRELCRQCIAYIDTNVISEKVTKIRYSIAFEYLEETGYLKEDVSYFSGVQKVVTSVEKWEEEFLPSVYRGLRDFNAKTLVRDYIYIQEHKKEYILEEK